MYTYAHICVDVLGIWTKLRITIICYFLHANFCVRILMLISLCMFPRWLLEWNGMLYHVMLCNSLFIPTPPLNPTHSISLIHDYTVLFHSVPFWVLVATFCFQLSEPEKLCCKIDVIMVRMHSDVHVIVRSFVCVFQEIMAVVETCSPLSLWWDRW